MKQIKTTARCDLQKEYILKQLQFSLSPPWNKSNLSQWDLFLCRSVEDCAVNVLISMILGFVPSGTGEQMYE